MNPRSRLKGRTTRWSYSFFYQSKCVLHVTNHAPINFQTENENIQGKLQTYCQNRQEHGILKLLRQKTGSVGVRSCQWQPVAAIELERVAWQNVFPRISDSTVTPKRARISPRLYEETNALTPLWSPSQNILARLCKNQYLAFFISMVTFLWRYSKVLTKTGSSD